MERYRAAAAKLGRTDLTESGNLLYEQERTEVVDWLSVNGWDVSRDRAGSDGAQWPCRAV
jgi:hypothetical protein